MRTPRRDRLVLGVAVTLAYVITARVGFGAAVTAEQVTTVWAPTGIAEAALLLCGTSLWPAVFVGAFLANAGTNAPVWTAVAIAAGNTLEAVLAATLLRARGFDPSFRRTRDAVAFILIAAIAGPMVAATIGVTTLGVAQVQPWTRFLVLWRDWLVGDGLGALIIAPAILTMLRPVPGFELRRRSADTGLLIALVLLVTGTVFATAAASPHRFPLEFAAFPIVMAAAVRVAQPGTSLVVLAASTVSIWQTLHHRGPFGTATVDDGLVFLQIFMAMLASSGVILAAAISDRFNADRRRAAAQGVSHALAHATRLDDAAAPILSALCVNLHWDAGVLWTVDQDRHELRVMGIWRRDDTLQPFADATSGLTFARGIGLPGRVWAAGAPEWLEKVADDPDFARAESARKAGFRGAFAVPLLVGAEVFGVVECFRPAITAPDSDLLATMAAVGTYIGQFIARTNMEGRIREREMLTRAILNAALDAVITMDHRGAILDFNPAAERMFGYSREEMKGRELASLMIPEAMRDTHRRGLERYLVTGESALINRRVETTAVRSDGETFPVEVSIASVRTEGPPIFTGFVRDVTRRARAEAERLDLLEREREARQEAQAASRAKDEFLATLSHELRTPLTAVVGWSHMLLTGVVSEERIRHALEVINRNALAQVQLVDDLMDVSRIITGGLRLHVESLDVRTIVEASLDVVRPAAASRRIAVHAPLPASPVLLTADGARLQQIVWNLLSNAVKFTPEGGAVRVMLADAGDRVRIRIEDNGPGIPAEFLAHAFERFRQADASTTRRHGGLGLGLAIVRHLTELHGGVVTVENQLAGTGAIFTIELPRSAAAES
jgi:PAS domain S-box-containing protein